MREIKFRAWDDSCNRMFNTVTSIEFGNNAAFIAVYGQTPFFWRAMHNEDHKTELHQANGDDTFLMQYTGLKDKNGGEIYEGDVVRYGGLEYKVEYDDASFNLIGELDSHTLGFVTLQHCEVIGNIYENPELLKEPS